MQEEEKKAPLICLLTTGSDPCSQVEGMARAAETEYRQISMGQVFFFRFWWLVVGKSGWDRLVVGFLDFGLTGFVHQGQEDSARKMITEAILNGHWLMLQVRGTMDTFANMFSRHRTVTSVLTSVKKSSQQWSTRRTCTATLGNPTSF